MRYFKNTCGYVFLAHEQKIIDYYLKMDYKEVIVTDKSEPKKFKEKIALFRNSSGSLETFMKNGLRPPSNYWTQLSDWIEIEFVDRSDE